MPIDDSCETLIAKAHRCVSSIGGSTMRLEIACGAPSEANSRYRSTFFPAVLADGSRCIPTRFFLSAFCVVV